jgi:hypothetical protein
MTDPVLQNTGGESSTNRTTSHLDTVIRSDPIVYNNSIVPVTSKHVGDFLPPKTSSISRRPIVPVQPAAVVSNLVQFENELAEMNLMIPPRREYSFGRKSSSLKSTADPPSRDSPSSRPSTALPPRPLASRPSTGIVPSPEPSRDNSRPSTGLPPLPLPTFAENGAIADQVCAIALHASDKTAINQTARPSTSAGTLQKSVISSKRAPSKKAAARPSTAAAQISAAKLTSSARKNAPLATLPDFDTTIQGSSSDTLHTAPSSKSNNQPKRDAQLQSSLFQAAEALSDPSSVTVQGDHKDSLASYATLPYDERMRIIENMLISAVGDENFVKLCQDVSGCWQRIGIDA